ncbi:MAG: oligopeptidase A [Candidatus Competibacterales bacterium]
MSLEYPHSAPDNPLLTAYDMPPFGAITPEHVEPAVETVLADNRQRIEALLAATDHYTWDNLIAPLEELQDRLEKLWSPVSHLNGVMNSPELRAAYNACLPKLSAYYTDLNQHEGLFNAYRQIAAGEVYAHLDPAQRRVIDHALRDFRLAGIGLPAQRRQRYKAIMQELSRLQAKFQENVLDATQAWEKFIDDPEALAGLPESTLELARQNARRQEREGYVLNLEFPCYLPVISYADDPNLRREIYHAYATRASEQAPSGDQWDNSPLMEQILALRFELATLLGFANYAEYSLETKMANSGQEVEDFILDLAHRARPQAAKELGEIQDFAREQFGVEHLAAWDIPYYGEKLREHRYHLTQEELRPYFPEHQVLQGLFAIIERLFGVAIQPVTGVEVWHPDVRCFEIHDGAECRGRFYLDLYARANKRGGAWMDGCITRRQTPRGLQRPVAYLVCNFTPPVGEEPALFTHDEVETLFHEFGHGLHHLLTRVDYAPVAGISGVEWDAVELPSQLLENWCWEREGLDLLARHYQSHQPLPETLFERMRAAKHFQGAMMMVRQLEFALFDWRLHRHYDPARGARILETLEEVRDQVAVVKPPAFNRFPHGFMHIFSGGYAAGYYSYKWAEVLAADAFARFEEDGIFHRPTGEALLRSILETGGTRDALENFKAFRGREPEVDALLRQSGIEA